MSEYYERRKNMQLNPNIIRGILLTVEETCTFNIPLEYIKDRFESEYLAEYSHEEIIYHIHQCEKSNLVDNVHYYDGGTTVLIRDLTPQGHEFLANIRNDSIWKRTLLKASDASLPILLEIAKNIATKHFLG